MKKLLKITSLISILVFLISACGSNKNDISTGRTLEYTLKAMTIKPLFVKTITQFTV